MSRYTPGNFSFLPAAEAALYKNAYDAITAEGLWDFFRDQTPPDGKGYMFWGAPELKKLEPHLEPMGHSGGSYGFTMRTMEAIAKKGWDQFVFENMPDEPATPGPPPPMNRCGPRGEDPYKEDRKEARARAAAGCPCPTNQHGCLYFSASEWRFCPMCEWLSGVAEGRAADTLTSFGVAKVVRAEESAHGQDLSLNRDQLADVLKDTKCFSPAVADAEWAQMRKDSPGCANDLYLTRSELNNLLMRHGAPIGVLTDELWAELQADYQ
jgi:hypothetical protein